MKTLYQLLREPLASPGSVRAQRPADGPPVQFRDPIGFEWNHYDLPIAKLPVGLSGLRILHLSDLHFRARWMRACDDLIERCRRDAPDLVLFTGDFVESKHDHRLALPFVQRLIENLQSKLGTFAIIGNHDLPPFEQRAGSWKLTFIHGRRLCLTHNGATIELIGLPGPERKDLTREFVQSIPPRQTDALRIVLSHFPDALSRTYSLQADLFLAGHTHGGQICLPGGFPPIQNDGLPRLLAKGVHRVGSTWLVVNRGFGFAKIPLRVFCPAEVIEIRLTIDD